MRSFIVVVSIFLLGTALLGGWIAHRAAASERVKSPDEGDGPVGWLGDAVRIDGRTVPSAARLAATFVGEEGEEDDNPTLTAPTPHVIMDAWTRRPASPLTAEDYDFVWGESVTLTVFVKVGEFGMPGGAMMDFVLVPAGINTMPPIPAPAIFIDDVWFAPIDPGAVRLFTFSIQLDSLHAVFPAGSCIDWFAAADFNAASNPDADLDGNPDCCVEANPIRFLESTGSEVDNVGAAVLRFFVPGRMPLHVFQPHPPLPGAKAIGTKAGEDGVSRPWCFNLR